MWWMDFFYTPLAIKFGDHVGNYDLQKIFKLKRSLDNQEEFKSYYHWRSDMDRKKTKGDMYSADGKFIGMAPEQDDTVVEEAMESAEKYKQFLFSRGLR